MTEYDAELPDELYTLRVVAETIGDNATTEDEMLIARVLMNLLMRLELAEKKLN